MADNKFEIKIIKEADGSDANLADLSVAAAKSLAEILESLAKIAEYENNNDDVKIKVTSGSACAAIEAPAPKLAVIKNNIDKVATYESEDDVYITNLRNIQEVVTANGLTYEAHFKSDNLIVDLTETFKQPRKFRKRRSVVKYTKRFHLDFFDGRLIAVGGKNPNIHIESSGESYTIDCNEEQARIVNKFLYQDIKISTWVKTAPNKKPKYLFCDHYINDQIYSRLKNFATNNTSYTGTEILKHIHYTTIDYLQDQNYGELRKFIKLFINELVDVQRQRSIITTLKEFRDMEEVKDLYQKLITLIESQTKKPVL